MTRTKFTIRTETPNIETITDFEAYRLTDGRMTAQAHRPPNDIKAPDGYLLGGERQVRKGGTVLFQRCWWQLPEGFAEQGEYVWVHEQVPDNRWEGSKLEVAPPGYRSFFAARSDRKTILVDATDRPGAKPGWRRAENKAWSEKMRGLSV